MSHSLNFIYLFFPSLFSHQISFLFLRSPSCLFLRSSSSPKIQFFFFTQKTRRKKYITHQKKKKKKREEAIAAEEESHSRRSPQQQWVYVGIENCTFDLEFCSLFGWLEVGGKEKKEEPLLLAHCDSSFRLLAIDEKGA